MNPFRALWDLVKSGWDVLSTVYSYNSLPWRILKAGGLVIFGFFNLMMANLLHSYKPHWNFLYLFMAYGSLLIVYGPIHHLVVIPLSLHLGRYSWARSLGIPRWGHVVMLVLFFVAVVGLAVFPLDVMTFELSASGLSGGPDVDPEVSCWRRSESTSIIECDVSDEPGIARVDVMSNGEVITSADTPPFRFTVDENQLQEVVGRRSFYVVPKDNNGNMLRRFVQQTEFIEPRERGDTQSVLQRDD